MIHTHIHIYIQTSLRDFLFEWNLACDFHLLPYLSVYVGRNVCVCVYTFPGAGGTYQVIKGKCKQLNEALLCLTVRGLAAASGSWWSGPILRLRRMWCRLFPWDERIVGRIVGPLPPGTPFLAKWHNRKAGELYFCRVSASIFRLIFFSFVWFFYPFAWFYFANNTTYWWYFNFSIVLIF